MADENPGSDEQQLIQHFLDDFGTASIVGEDYDLGLVFDLLFVGKEVLQNFNEFVHFGMIFVALRDLAQTVFQSLVEGRTDDRLFQNRRSFVQKRVEVLEGVLEHLEALRNELLLRLSQSIQNLDVLPAVAVLLFVQERLEVVRLLLKGLLEIVNDHVVDLSRALWKLIFESGHQGSQVIHDAHEELREGQLQLHLIVVGGNEDGFDLFVLEVFPDVFVLFVSNLDVRNGQIVDYFLNFRNVVSRSCRQSHHPIGHLSLLQYFVDDGVGIIPGGSMGFVVDNQDYSLRIEQRALQVVLKGLGSHEQNPLGSVLFTSELGCFVSSQLHHVIFPDGLDFENRLNLLVHQRLCGSEENNQPLRKPMVEVEDDIGGNESLAQSRRQTHQGVSNERCLGDFELVLPEVLLIQIEPGIRVGKHYFWLLTRRRQSVQLHVSWDSLVAVFGSRGHLLQSLLSLLIEEVLDGEVLVEQESLPGKGLLRDILRNLCSVFEKLIAFLSRRWEGRSGLAQAFISMGQDFLLFVLFNRLDKLP